MRPFASGDPRLNRLIDRVDEMNRLLREVRNAVPPELAPYCLSASWSGFALQVGVSHSAAANKLRLVAPSILTKLQASGVHASAIRPRVQVALQIEKPNPPKTLRMTDQAVDAFSKLADQVSDPGLRQAVEALLQRRRAK